MDDPQDYTAAGFDKLLSRGDSTPIQGPLDSQPMPSRAVAFDRSQVGGSFGDLVRIGNITLNGVDGNIILNDGNNDRLLLGKQTDGF